MYWLAAIEPDDQAGDALLLRPETAAARTSPARTGALRRMDASMLNGLYAALLTDGKQSNGADIRP